MRKFVSYVASVSLLMVLVLLSASIVSAVDLDKMHKITLLSVKELDNGSYEGGTASLTLDIKEGNGAVYIQSFPTSKVDTQTTTRIANEIACDLSSVGCDQYDFFYTLHADSSLVGGPSAGAATTLLTLSALEDIGLQDNMAMTGAITSGGIITPVSGIEEKVEAAAENDIDKVYVPEFSLIDGNISSKENASLLPSSNVTVENGTGTNVTATDNIPNATTNATTDETSENDNASDDAADNTTAENQTSEPGSSISRSALRSRLDNMSIDVVSVTTVAEAFNDASGGEYKVSDEVSITPPAEYVDRMASTAEELCSRTDNLFGKINDSKKNTSLFSYARDFRNKSKIAGNESSYYSKGSYCYTANLRLRDLQLRSANQSSLKDKYDTLQSSLSSFERSVENVTIETFSDLEAYVIVKERLWESEQYLDRINTSNITSSKLSFAIERYHSATSWTNFFDMDGKKLRIDTSSLHAAAIKELHNVETRLNLLRTFIPRSLLTDVEKEVAQANEYMRDGEYSLALFKASKGKAEADLFISTVALKEGVDSDLFSAKEKRVKKVISKQQSEGRFPILGYSYLDYSRRLIESDSVSALLFVEYGLQMSDLSKYFPTEVESSYPLFEEDMFYSFIAGFSSALVCMLIVVFVIKRNTSRSKDRSRSRKKNTRKSKRTGARRIR